MHGLEVAGVILLCWFDNIQRCIGSDISQIERMNSLGAVGRDSFLGKTFRSLDGELIEDVGKLRRF